MIPVIALVGRPNVGKSTLFNRLTHSRDALVANLPGLTRDRRYGEALLQGQRTILIDTGGIDGERSGVDAAAEAQSRQAIKEADLVLFLVDCHAGLTAADEAVGAELRRLGKKTLLVANKIDGANPDLILSEFHAMGLGDPQPIAAAHGRGLQSLIEAVLERLPPQPEEPETPPAETGVKIAVLGRPNVGKSTLVNRRLGEERVVVFDQPGTTRDSIYIPYERHGRRYTLIDTAGIRRRKNIDEAVEKFSIVKALQAIEDAHVVLLLVDARENLVDQDLHLLGTALEAGRAVVIVVNKWDGLDPEQRARIRSELERRLAFIDFARIHFISALHGTGVGELYKSIDEAYRAATRKLQTHKLTLLLQAAVVQHPPPVGGSGRRPKLRYAHAGGQNPPLIVIHGNQVDSIPESYRRYLERFFRARLHLSGTPIKVEFRGGENPYAERKNTLTERQLRKRRRLLEHVKKR